MWCQFWIFRARSSRNTDIILITLPMTFKVIYIMVLHRQLSIKLRAAYKAEDLNVVFTSFFNSEVSQDFLLRESIQGEELSAVYEDQFNVLFARFQLIQVHGIKGSTSMIAERTCQCPCRAALHHLWKVTEIRWGPWQWKTMSHLSVFKKDQKVNLRNYRPVSLTLLPGKNHRESPSQSTFLDMWTRKISGMDSLKINHATPTWLPFRIKWLDLGMTSARFPHCLSQHSCIQIRMLLSRWVNKQVGWKIIWWSSSHSSG